MKAVLTPLAGYRAMLRAGWYGCCNERRLRAVCNRAAQSAKLLGPNHPETRVLVRYGRLLAARERGSAEA